MDPSTAARMLATNRIAIGAALVLAPRLAGRTWVGIDSELAGAQVFARALGARDIALGAGMYRALEEGGSVRPWAQGAMLADGVDFVATLMARDALPLPARIFVLGVAGGSTAVSAWLSASLD